MIKLKTQKILSSLLKNKAHPILVEVVDYVTECLVVEKPNCTPVITSFFREGDRGVHGTIPVRGMDLRSTIYSRRWIGKLVDHVNGIFQYDPTRPSMRVLMFHDVGQGEHLHIQVHPNTIRR